MTNILDFLQKVFLPWTKEIANSSLSPFVRTLAKILSVIIYVASTVAVVLGLITMSSCSVPTAIQVSAKVRSESTGHTEMYTVELSQPQVSVTVPISTSTSARPLPVQNPVSRLCPDVPESVDSTLTRSSIMSPQNVHFTSMRGAPIISHVILKTGTPSSPASYGSQSPIMTPFLPLSPVTKHVIQRKIKRWLRASPKGLDLNIYKKNTTSYESN